MIKGILLLLKSPRLLLLIPSLLFNKQVPLKIKAFFILAVIYLLSPIDFLPDILPILGRIADLLILLVSITTLLGMTPENLLSRSQGKPKKEDGRGRVIDADYKFTDDSNETKKTQE